jgi:hypothetical protein
LDIPEVAQLVVYIASTCSGSSETAFQGGPGSTTDDALDDGTLQEELRRDAGLGDGGVVRREAVPGEKDRRGMPQTGRAVMGPTASISRQR